MNRKQEEKQRIIEKIKRIPRLPKRQVNRIYRFIQQEKILSSLEGYALGIEDGRKIIKDLLEKYGQPNT